jgi:phage FluMu gp28-like protein
MSSVCLARENKIVEKIKTRAPREQLTKRINKQQQQQQQQQQQWVLENCPRLSNAKFHQNICNLC